MIITPFLFYLFPDFPAQTIIGSSLLIIFFNSCLNMKNFYKSGKQTNYRALWPIILFDALGVIVGGVLSGYLAKSTIKLVLTIVLILVLIRLIFGKRGLSPLGPPRLTFFRTSLTGALSGFIAGVAGLGGGAFMVSFMIRFLRVPFSKVSLYTNSIIPFSTFTGVLTFLLMDTPTHIGGVFQKFQFGHLNFAVALCTVLGAAISSPIGVSLSQRANLVIIRRFLSSCSPLS